MAWTPGSQGHDRELKQSVDGTIDTADIYAEPVGHPSAAVVGRAAAIGGEREQQQDGGCVRLKFGEPMVMEQVGFEPAERRLRLAPRSG